MDRSHLRKFINQNVSKFFCRSGRGEVGKDERFQAIVFSILCFSASFNFLTMNMDYFYNQRKKTGFIKHCYYYHELPNVCEHETVMETLKDLEMGKTISGYPLSGIRRVSSGPFWGHVIVKGIPLLLS